MKEDNQWIVDAVFQLDTKELIELMILIGGYLEAIAIDEIRT